MASATPVAASATPVPTTAASQRPSCPYSDGGACLGVLAAGTYTTTQFHPKLTYQVAAGWSNDEDVAGNFLLLPPGNTLPNLNDITGDFIGIATSAAADAPDCSGQPAAGVVPTAADLGAFLGKQPGLAISGQQQVVIGGLHGEVLDIRMKQGWTKACNSPGVAQPVVPLLIGSGTSNFEHGISAGFAERLYLLDFSGAALAIEIVDASGGSHLDAYAQLVKILQFAP